MPKRTKCFTDQSLLYKYDKYLSNSEAKDISEYEWLPHTPIKKKIISKSPTYSPIGGYSPPKPLWSPKKKKTSSKDGSRKQTKCFLDKSFLNKYNSKSKSASSSYKYTTTY